MLTVLTKDIYSLDEYYELERNSEEKLEFFDGRVHSVMPATIIHEDILINTCFHLNNLLRDLKFSVYLSRLKIKVPSFGPYRYADLSAFSEPIAVEKFGEMDVATNPHLIVEILETDTAGYDRGEKFEYYKSIPSFSEFLLIASWKPIVTHFTKSGNNDWIRFEATDLNAKIPLPTLGVELLTAEIFREVNFPESPHF